VPHALPDTLLPYRFVTNKGVERFKIVNVVQEKPVLLCEVEVLEEDEDESEDVSGTWIFQMCHTCHVRYNCHICHI
jgi:hypothetical protein